jgi:predicted Rossmann fold nucleotide-binding protein DprA/Smf involved in DNA uptake
MKTLICGSRNITDCGLVETAVTRSGFVVTSVISGGARGVDRLAEEYAKAHGLPITVMVPHWKQLGRGAGVVRTREMIKESSQVIAIWDGYSKGTGNTIETAQKLGRRVYVHEIS